MFTLDESWTPPPVSNDGQQPGGSLIVMNDWIVGATNTVPATGYLTTFVINQGDASKYYSVQPDSGSTSGGKTKEIHLLIAAAAWEHRPIRVLTLYQSLTVGRFYWQGDRRISSAGCPARIDSLPVRIRSAPVTGSPKPVQIRAIICLTATRMVQWNYRDRADSNF
jgi:hypothetical protein